MNLDELAFECGTDKGTRCKGGLVPKGYTKYYSTHFAHMREKPIRFLEIGVARGCSTRMWESYFPNATLYGMDINPNCAKRATSRTTIFIGDQADENFLRSFSRETGGDFDIIVDDGGHMMKQQICSFLALFPYIRPGGSYVIEDLHTSYSKEYGGGYKSSASMIEFLKTLVDHVNRWPGGPSIASIHFYKGIAFVQKGEA